MTRKSLKPQLNQIRAWVQQGRTDAWIAHQLEVTVQQIESFKNEQGLNPDGATTPSPGAVDLRDEDDALIAAQLEAEEAKAAAEAKAAEEAKAAAAAEAAARRAAAGNGSGTTLEGTFDHGDEGYGLWLDPSIADDPVYAEHWAGHRAVEITIEEDRIVITRAGSQED